MRYIACDLDGTLLFDGISEFGGITLQNRQAVWRWIDAGNKFVIATGRGVNYRDVLRETYGLDLDIIGLNGAATFMDKELVDCDYISKDKVLDVVSFLKQYQEYVEFSIMTLKDDQIFQSTTGKCHTLFKQVEDSYVAQHVADYDIDTYFRQKDTLLPSKLFLIVFEQKDVGMMIDVLQARYGDDFVIVSSSGQFIEMTSKHVSKGNALRKLAKRVGLPLTSFITIGDSGNDVSMFEITPHSYVMKHAQDFVLQAANHTVSAVHEVIDALLL